MTLKYANIILSGILVLLISCVQKSNTPDSIKFENITRLNIFGAEIGEIDTSDWGFDDTWTNKENSLFSDSMFTKSCRHNVYYGILGYPNPCKGLFVVHFYKDERTLIKMGIFDLQEKLVFKYRIVDKYFRIMTSVDSVLNNSYSFNFRQYLPDIIYNQDSVPDNKQMPADSVFRVYYQLLDINNECIYKGHGDIIIKK